MLLGDAGVAVWIMNAHVDAITLCGWTSLKLVGLVRFVFGYLAPCRLLRLHNANAGDYFRLRLLCVLLGVR